MFLHILIAATLAVATIADQTTLGHGSDSTCIPGAKGAVIVEQTMKVIKSSCIFDDDKLFMRRLAYVESFDGVDPDAYRTGYHGGIWQVGEAMFNKLKEPNSHRVLSKYTNQFKDAFNKDWASTTWEDCRKPLFSALAARLYIQLRIDPRGIPFPRDIPAQGRLWTTYYRGTDPNVFITAAERLDKGCKVYGIDLVFVIDSSGSVGQLNFEKSKMFAKEVVQSFDVGVNQTQIGFVSYGSSVNKNFYLNTYKTRSQVMAAINDIRYMGGGTNSHLALDVLYQTMFTSEKGARDVLKGFRRVGIFLTAGHSNIKSKTIVSAKKVHDAEITMVALGVGSNVDMTELQAIASTPECLYLILLRGFDDVESLKYAIEEVDCEYEDDCRGIQCKNGATCVDNMQDSYTCSCAPGFEGKHCETDIDECQSSPCTAQGTSQDMVNGFECDCVPGYTGTLCNEVELFDCTTKSPCNAKSREANKYLFAHVDRHKFVQCDNSDGCFPIDCPPGLTWDHPLQACTR